ncbi:hypothetical protein AVEN_154717-1 [Araneus ventricosus]|uniref:Uncharacterized protein n=1 Tax=Araneus ventricosus TaxID=182803 RepID=A0A4Y2A355_ARAVE|nr:hypothetical protein AVEN_154717-1 [Araneus ventricosus]
MMVHVHLNSNTNTALKTQELLQGFKWEVWTIPTAEIQQPVWFQALSEIRFSSESDAKSVVENWLNLQDLISSSRVKQVGPAFR